MPLCVRESGRGGCTSPPLVCPSMDLPGRTVPPLCRVWQCFATTEPQLAPPCHCEEIPCATSLLPSTELRNCAIAISAILSHCPAVLSQAVPSPCIAVLASPCYCDEMPCPALPLPCWALLYSALPCHCFALLYAHRHAKPLPRIDEQHCAVALPCHALPLLGRAMPYHAIASPCCEALHYAIALLVDSMAHHKLTT